MSVVSFFEKNCFEYRKCKLLEKSHNQTERTDWPEPALCMFCDIKGVSVILI